MQETKINPILIDSYFDLDGYNLICRDRIENQGGGPSFLQLAVHP